LASLPEIGFEDIARVMQVQELTQGKLLSPLTNMFPTLYPSQFAMLRGEHPL
jgi:hypothetical protein